MDSSVMRAGGARPQAGGVGNQPRAGRHGLQARLVRPQRGHLQATTPNPEQSFGVVTPFPGRRTSSSLRLVNRRTLPGSTSLKTVCQASPEPAHLACLARAPSPPWRPPFKKRSLASLVSAFLRAALEGKADSPKTERVRYPPHSRSTLPACGRPPTAPVSARRPRE